MMDIRNVKPALGMIPAGLTTQDEIIDKRRPNGKTFGLGKDRFRITTSLGLVHYKDDYAKKDEGWKEIDLSLSAVENNVIAAPYNISVFSDKVGYTYVSKQGGQIDVELVEIGGQPVSNQFTTRREGNQFFWDSVMPGVDMKILLRPQSAEIFKMLADENAARSFVWDVKESVESNARFRRSTFGGDTNEDRLEINTDVDIIPSAPDIQHFRYTETWTGRISRIVDKATRQKAWFDNPIYPVIIDEVTQELIVANADDGYENITASNWLSSTTFAGGNFWLAGMYAAATTYFNGGVRFQTLGIPQGATINTATLTFQVPQLPPGNNPTSFIIYGDDVDSAPAWSNNSRPSQITQTTANTVWSPPNSTGTFTVSITSIVQEIISRSGWASGSIRFGVINQATGGGNAAIYVYDYNQGQAGAAVLDVTFTSRTPRRGFINYQIPGIL